MTTKGDTLWENGIKCVLLLALAIGNTPLFPRSVSITLTPIIILILILTMLFYHKRQSRYSKRELELEQQDERSLMIQTQAVWHCYVAEDRILLGAALLFSLSERYEAFFRVLMWMLILRSLLTFGIRWRLNRKY